MKKWAICLVSMFPKKYIFCNIALPSAKNLSLLKQFIYIHTRTHTYTHTHTHTHAHTHTLTHTYIYIYIIYIYDNIYIYNIHIYIYIYIYYMHLITLFQKMINDMVYRSLSHHPWDISDKNVKKMLTQEKFFDFKTLTSPRE